MAARLLTAALGLALGAGAAGAATLEATVGQALFQRNWISAPSSQHSASGLGPHYDARACSACHSGAGSGSLTVGAGLTVHLADRMGGPDPLYGDQLQTKAAPGADIEGQVQATWADAHGLRAPRLRFARLAFGPLGAGVHAGLRRAPPLRGAGLLDEVPTAEILHRADPEDRDHDGVSGRASWVVQARGAPRLGRWGWKAAQPDLRAQTEISMLRDLGVATSDAAPAEETAAERRREETMRPPAQRSSGEIPVALVRYLASLSAPQALDTATAGYRTFQQIGCGACHAALRTAQGRPVPAYTDLLLHDLGPGLDDGVAEGGALSQEWRTAPLWSVGEELGRGGLLHDGRARSIAEAVSWHGGEASRARRRFQALDAPRRRAVATFLGGW